jgi:hypothetical protein
MGVNDSILRRLASLTYLCVDDGTGLVPKERDNGVAKLRDDAARTLPVIVALGSRSGSEAAHGKPLAAADWQR